MSFKSREQLKAIKKIQNQSMNVEISCISLFDLFVDSFP